MNSFSSQARFSTKLNPCHWICSFPEGQVDTSWFHVVHFQDYGVVLEVPARVEQCYTVLENPTFSPVGVLLKSMLAVRNFIPISSVTLIYYYLNLKDVTLHLYLIPNDCTIRKVTLRTRNVGLRWADKKNLKCSYPLVEILYLECWYSSITGALVFMSLQSSLPPHVGVSSSTFNNLL